MGQSSAKERSWSKLHKGMTKLSIASAMLFEWYRTADKQVFIRAKKKPLSLWNLTAFGMWCPGPESNRHALRRGILSPVKK